MSSDYADDIAVPRPRSLARDLIKPLIPAPARRWLTRRAGGIPDIGAVRMGGLRRVTPISDDFGYDRGTPVDRHYIEAFLDRRRADIRGRVLEIGERTYTQRFGSRVERSDVLHVKAGNPDATYVDDLSAPSTLPDATYDCLVVTQTLHLIYDMPAAVATMRRLLRPGGVALVTFPGITQVDQGEWGGTWYWSLTMKSARRLFDEAFDPTEVEIDDFGNVLTASAFLYGLAAEELSPEEIDHRDPRFPVIITVRARRPE